MNTFSLIRANDYTIQTYPAYAPITWSLISSSNGIEITNPLDLNGAVTINEAIKDSEEINPDTQIIKNVLYKSVQHIFYNNYNIFFSQSANINYSKIADYENFYVISVGQNFYGNSIRPGTFELEIDTITPTVKDDSYGNLVVSSSGNNYQIGNIFYERGIAVLVINTSSAASDVTTQGIKISGSSTINLSYSSNLSIERHQINVQLSPAEFTFSSLNPSIRNSLIITSSVTKSFEEKNIPKSGSNSWKIYDLMSSEIIKPYVTSIGLYNNRNELLAVAKLSQPIQRTFATDQIFIVRFDVSYDVE